MVICDAAPNLSGNWALDHARSIDLAEVALEVASQSTDARRQLLVKVFQGDMFDAFVNKVREALFKRARRTSRRLRGRRAQRST